MNARLPVDAPRVVHDEFDAYAASGAHGGSGLHTLVDSTPAHYAARGLLTDTAATSFGRLLHCLVLEPDQFALRYAVKPPGHDGRTIPGKAWVAANAGLSLVSQSDYAAALAMRDSVWAHPSASRLMGPKAQTLGTELSLYWTDPRTGVRCRARIDSVVRMTHTSPAVMLADLKTTEDASARAFERSCRTYGYVDQGAHYGAGWDATHPDQPAAAFAFVVVEKKPPHACAVYVIDDESAVIGADRRRIALDTIAECERTGHWPAYSAQIESVNPYPLAYSRKPAEA